MENRRRKTKNRFKKVPQRPAPCISDTHVVGGVERVMHEQSNMVVHDGTVVADMTVPEGHILVPTHATHPRFPGQMLPVIDAETAHDGRVKLALEWFDERETFELGDDGFPVVCKSTERKIAWVLRDKVICSPIKQPIKPGKALKKRKPYAGTSDQGAWAGLVRAGRLDAIES